MSSSTLTRPRRPRDLVALLDAHDRVSLRLASLSAHDLPHGEELAALASIERAVGERHPRVACELARGAWLADGGDPHETGQECLVCAGRLP